VRRVFQYRSIIHLHIPALPIAVARVSRAPLRNRPVAVAPLQSDRPVVLSVSSEARREGVFKGMSLSKAMKRCPGLKVLPPDPEVLEGACRHLAQTAARYTPIWEPSRPGHLYLDLTGAERLWGPVHDAARRFQREIRDHLGLSGTLGVAANKLVSNVASRLLPPGRDPMGMFNVEYGQEADFMAPLRVDVVPGIGRVRQKILLEDLNITRVGQLAAMDVGRLKLIFGRRAVLIHQYSLGIDATPVYAQAKKPMVSESAMLPQGENDDGKLLKTFWRLVETCFYQMRKRRWFPMKAGFLVRYGDQVVATRSLKISPAVCGNAQTDGLHLWNPALFVPLEKLFFDVCRRRVRVRFLKVWFREFRALHFQLSLFHVPSPREEKTRRLVHAMDHIRDRYGEDVVFCGRAA
jgi:DNA polymerase IV